MPRIQTFSNTAIFIYAAPAEHPPPHFHIVGPDLNVAVEIEALVIMRGESRPKEIAQALAWAADNVELLMQKWEFYNGRD